MGVKISKMRSKKSLHIVFLSIEAVGHMNSSIGIAQVLQEAGHRITFIISGMWKGRLSKYGFEEAILPQQTKPEDVDPGTHSSDQFLDGGAVVLETPLEKITAIWTGIVPTFIQEVKDHDKMLEELIKELRPDVMILDQVLCIPAVELSGIPWIYSCSFQPLMGIQMKSDLDDECLPPNSSGLPTDGDKEEWSKFRQSLNKAMEEMADGFNNYVVSRGLPPLTKYKLARFSDFMNIYGYPLELDYIDIRPLPAKWFRFDNLKRTEVTEDFVIPEQLRDRPAKLVYFSMGTIGSGDLKLMNRLLEILAKSEHRFIVSKGPKHQLIQLSDNMWGQQSVPQTQVLPVVDLFITHGGNNSVTEAFYYGKPMIVMGLFSDQLDNAQRVHEKGLGLKMDPHKCTEEELLNGIDFLLNDKVLIDKMNQIGERIRSDNSIARLPELIEQRLKDFKRNS